MSDYDFDDYRDECEERSISNRIAYEKYRLELRVDLEKRHIQFERQTQLEKQNEYCQNSYSVQS